MDIKKIKQIKLKGGDSMKTKIKQEKGITLIALVITIVVLLILAGVSVNAIFSDNGIIKRAQEAQNKMDEAQQKDLNSINELNNWINEATKEKYVFTLGSNTYEAEEGMTWRQWVNSKYNTIGMRITTKPTGYGMNNGYCIAYKGTDKFENASMLFAIRALTTSTEIMTIKGEHTENDKDLFDVLAIVNKRSDSWVNFYRR